MPISVTRPMTTKTRKKAAKNAAMPAATASSLPEA
jgi:hypothetical protein